MEKYRVLIVDDHTIVREGLRGLLERQPEIEVVGEASTGVEAVTLASMLCPSTIIMDIRMGDMDGIHAAAEILRKEKSINIIILSMSDDEADVRRAIQAGVHGYLVKQSAANILVTAIKEVEHGNAFFSPSVAKILMETDQPAATESTLTCREEEVVKLIVDGRNVREIAHALGLAEKTVEKHRRHIRRKLGVRDLAGVIRYALTKGIVK